jgi:hypothetical protein
MAAVATGGGVLTFNGRAGAVTLTAADVSAVGGALLASPALTGLPTAPTAGPGTNTTQLATCAYVQAAVAAATAGVASFNGRTGAVTLIATDVTAVLPASTTNPTMNGVASPGTQAAWARGDHVHPVDTSRYAATNPSNFQTAAQVTASLANYLPLAGGSLSGALSGTTIGASGSIISSGGALLSAIGNVQSQGATAHYYLLNAGGTIVGQVWWDGAAVYLVNGSGYLLVDDGGNISITGPTALKPGGGEWAASSDARIKTVLGDYDKGLDAVLALRPVEYVYRGNDTPTQGGTSLHKGVAESQTPFVGLVAQAVEAVFPEMVARSAGFIDGVAVDDLRSLDRTPLIYALVNAVKTLASRVAALEAA